MQNRRKSRELALQMLYAHEIRENDAPATVLDHSSDFFGAPVQVREYATTLYRTVLAHRDRLDQLVQQHASNWKLARMAVIDRNVLRMAAAELVYMQDVPFKVVIDEAVEVVKAFGNSESGKFVNGVLDSLYKEVATYTADERMNSIHGKDSRAV